MLVPSRHQADRPARLARAAAIRGASGKLWPADRATELLEAIIESGDRVAIEGDNQKQADFLAAALAKVDPARIHDLHMVQSVLALPDHLAVSNAVSRADWIFRTPDPTGSPNSLPVVVIEKDGDGFSITSDHLTVTAKIPGIDPDTSAAGFELMSETRLFF
jgi:hypothetical protein